RQTLPPSPHLHEGPPRHQRRGRIEAPYVRFSDSTQGAVLHGISAVAELKGFTQDGLSQDDTVLHGISAVAELKEPRRREPLIPDERPPRHQRRGRIEGMFPPLATCTAGDGPPRHQRRGRIEGRKRPRRRSSCTRSPPRHQRRGRIEGWTSK